MAKNLYAFDIGGNYAHQSFIVIAYTWMGAQRLIEDYLKEIGGYVTIEDVRNSIQESLYQTPVIPSLVKNVDREVGVIWTSGYAE